MERLEANVVLVLAASLGLMAGTLMKKGERRRGLAFLLAWAVPGAGHACLGKWKKGLFFLGLLGGTYLFGLYVSGFRTVTFDENPFYYFGKYGSGLTVLLANLFSARLVVRSGFHPSWFDPGLLYVCVAGLLNLVLVINTLDVKPVAAPAAAPPAGPEPEPAAAPPPAAPEQAP